MRRTIAALIAGIVLGTCTTAVAATSLYWAKSGSGYACEGIGNGVTCNAGLYQVGVTPDFVFIQKRTTKQTFGCRKYGRWAGCVRD